MHHHSSLLRLYVGLLPCFACSCQVQVETSGAQGENSAQGWTPPVSRLAQDSWEDSATEVPNWNAAPDTSPGSESEGSREYPPLVVLDPHVLQAHGSNDDPEALYSLPAILTRLAGRAEFFEDFTRNWLEQWADGGTVDGDVVLPRPGVRSMLIEPWSVPASKFAASVPLVSAKYNTMAPKPAEDAGSPTPDAGSPPGSDAGPEPYDGEPVPYDAGTTDNPTDAVGYPARDAGSHQSEPKDPTYVLDPANTPFRLIAIMNRVDLATDACDERGGELRFVFTGRSPTTDAPLALTLIVEVPLPPSGTRAGWARRFTQLDGLTQSELSIALAELVADVLERVDPLSVKLRTNERALGDPSSSWQMREFRPTLMDGRVALRPSRLAFTPRADVDATELADHVSAPSGNGEPFLDLPSELLALVTDIPSAGFTWNIPGLSEGTRAAVSRATCNGCHGGDTQSLPFRHVAALDDPAKPAQLSRFLYDPDGLGDELGRRHDRLFDWAEVVCGELSPPTGY